MLPKNWFVQGTTSACAENTRGTVFCQVDGGTTSACAENTLDALMVDLRSVNYLRVRGEYTNATAGLMCYGELPPRARRIHGVLPKEITTLGTTSACAENTD